MKKIWALILCMVFLSLPVSAEGGYDLLYPFEGGVARAVLNLKWGLLNEQLEAVTDFSWDYIGELSENRRLVKKGELYGFLNGENGLVIAPEYVQAYNFSEGLCAVKNSAGQWGYIDASGALVIPFQYDVANDFSCGLALVKTGGLYGYINKNNQLVIPAVYEEAYPFSENRACVRVGSAYGYLDTTGAMAIPAAYELAFDFCSEGAVVKQGSYGVIDQVGQVKIPLGWEQISPHIEGGRVKVKQNGLWMFADLSGNILSQGYEDLGSFSEGLCPAKIGGRYGYLDETFQLVIPADWATAGDFSGGMAPVSSGGRYGYIDQAGNLVTELIYAYCLQASGGFGAVLTDDGRYAFVMLPSKHLINSGIVSREDEPQQPKPAQGFETVVEGQMILLKLGYPFLQKNQENISLDVAPIAQSGRTLLPIRHVIEAMGGQVLWDGAQQKISITYNHHSVVLYLGRDDAYVDGRRVPLDVAPSAVNGRTLLPVRFVAESLGCTVEWLAESQEILIVY